MAATFSAPTRSHELGRQDARAGTDVEHPHALVDAGKVGELRRQQHRVAAHEAVVGVGRDVEGHGVTVADRPR